MTPILTRRFLFPAVLFCFLDLVAVGAGMGIPVFAIFLGAVVGWFAPSILSSHALNLRRLLKMCLITACLTSGFTLVLMVIIWGPISRMLLDPAADFANFGIPLILFDPKASFIGWIVLMVVISPVLQLLATTFASFVRLVWQLPTSLREE